MTTSFTRKLGSQAGVELRPVRDFTDGIVIDNADQCFGIAMRSTRGRIDKAFPVTRDTFLQKLGKPESLTSSPLNEAQIHVYEALKLGTYAAIVSRLVTSEAKNNQILALVDGTFGVEVEPVIEPKPAGTINNLFKLKHLDCFNDGLIVEYNIQSKKVDGAFVPSSDIFLQIKDPANLTVLSSFQGSLDPNAVDENGDSLWLPNVVSTNSLSVEVECDNVLVEVPIDHVAYGLDEKNQTKWAKSSVLIYFNEGGAAYVLADYDNAINRLRKTEHGFEYIATGGSTSSALIGLVDELAYEQNKSAKLDIPADKNIEAAIMYVEQLGLRNGQYWQLMYHPYECIDPLGLNGRISLGSSTYNIALCNQRNGYLNGLGFAPKQYVVAGKGDPQAGLNFTITRQGLKQLYNPSEYELSLLADAGIVPVIHKTYNAGSMLVFADQLTAHKSKMSDMRNASVVERFATMDKAVSAFATEIQHFPMEKALKSMYNFLAKYTSDMNASSWLKPVQKQAGMDELMRISGDESSHYRFGNNFYAFIVKRDGILPNERYHVEYAISYDGNARQVILSQSLV
jgi:hypothetical protein